MKRMKDKNMAPEDQEYVQSRLKKARASAIDRKEMLHRIEMSAKEVEELSGRVHSAQTSLPPMTICHFKIIGPFKQRIRVCDRSPEYASAVRNIEGLRAELFEKLRLLRSLQAEFNATQELLF